jgi:hypothetical protein
MRILVMQERLAKESRDQDRALEGLPPDVVSKAIERLATRWQEIQGLWDDLNRPRPYPDGDSCIVREDEPLFGENNPPDPDEFLYHYTRLWTLPKIRKSGSLRFRPLRMMNDPHEALESHAFMSGLAGPAGEPLVMTSADARRFESVDWISEVNSARGNVKVGAFSMDSRPNLSDIDPDWAGVFAPRRFWANRGFAHPRMWAQYADHGRGVCLVVNSRQLEAAIRASVNGRFAWGRGEVTYQPAEHDLTLGFLDARELLRKGASQALLGTFEESLLTKHADWAHEAELRFFVMDGTEDPWSVPIGDDVFAGLILGPWFDDRRHHRNVRAFARSFGISGRVRRLAWTHGRPQLAPVAI